MAFDQSTRNRLQKFVSNARAVLSEEFTRQLQATYGLDPKQGTVASLDSLTHLDNLQRQTAHLLRETLAHYLATTPGKGEKDRTKQVLDRIVREQAFTVLNRLAALRMAEARGFLLESIAKSHSSKGFQLYRQLSGTAHGETGDAYRNYLFSLFDEFSLDLAVLFDRHSAQGRLFPRESALLELLGEINHADIEHLWAEDETIGWIYQYFNSQEERKKMRAESQAPRNSRELAVRNQFFTPRYVVEFLTDNTLGRIWYEMTQGNTGLVDSCRYLVRRPTEIFLKPGEDVPETEQSDEALSQLELLQQPVYIPHRPLKDPRTIRMLDPACGSMHFGLYAFDLFERIYLEAWQLEQQLGAAAFTREDGLASLQEAFASLDAFKQQIPKLIIEHNIHGVDIDPRAVQIAGLSLWQRAQRAWHQQGIKPQQRPTIVKSNIVCAEPMPGEKALLQEFNSKLNPPVLGQLLEVIFDKMQLAGEAGTLLKIEEEIQTAIQEARKQWLKQSGGSGTSDLFQAELDVAIPQAKLGFDLRGVNDESFWGDAEQRILQALSDYAERAEATADQKRLFAEDAAKGFAFIDLCRKRFDVVLMNPPFGEPAISVNSYLSKTYKYSCKDLLMTFIDRARSNLSCSGLVGAITGRMPLFLSDSRKWRENILISEFDLDYLLDLGDKVLEATVDVAAYVLSSKTDDKKSLFFRLISEKDKESTLTNCVCSFPLEYTFIRNVKDFYTIPGTPISYWIGTKILQLFSVGSSLESDGRTVQQGMSTKNNFRYFRDWYEVDIHEIKWKPVVKTESYGPYFPDISQVLDYGSGLLELEADLLKKYPYLNGDANWVLHRESSYFEPGLTFSSRQRKFSPRPVPAGCLFTHTGLMIFPRKDELNWLPVYLESRIVRSILGFVAPPRKIEIGYASKIPVPINPNSKIIERLEELQRLRLSSALSLVSNDETSVYFSGYDPSIEVLGPDNSDAEIDELVMKLLGLSDREKNFLVAELSSVTGLKSDDEVESAMTVNGTDYSVFDRTLSYLIGKLFGRWSDDLNHSLHQRLSSYFDAFPRSPSVLEKAKISDVLIIPSELLSSKMFSSLEKDCPTIKNSELSAEKLGKYLSSPNGFFATHLKMYSKTDRCSPIYWLLQTSSCSYSVWIYYHSLSRELLYSCVIDFVEPKLEQVEQDLNGLRNKSARSSQEEKELEKLSDLGSELRDFREELIRVAKFWKPNLNDGVQITAAPLWKLFQHKAWQKKLKETWEKLELGEYDWAHLACSIWPDRVLRKCQQDRSLAIAHDVEEHFWHEVEVPVKRGKKLTGATKLEWQPKDINETAMLELIKQIREERGL